MKYLGKYLARNNEATVAVNIVITTINFLFLFPFLE